MQFSYKPLLGRDYRDSQHLFGRYILWFGLCGQIRMLRCTLTMWTILENPDIVVQHMSTVFYRHQDIDQDGNTFVDNKPTPRHMSWNKPKLEPILTRDKCPYCNLTAQVAHLDSRERPWYQYTRELEALCRHHM